MKMKIRVNYSEGVLFNSYFYKKYSYVHKNKAKQMCATPQFQQNWDEVYLKKDMRRFSFIWGRMF
jgi:hypothetical protein